MVSSACLLSARPRSASFPAILGQSTRPEEKTATFLAGFSVKKESGARRSGTRTQPEARIAKTMSGRVLFMIGTLSQDSRLAHVFQHARMDQVLPRRSGERVGERGFLRLLELCAERCFGLVQRARELVRGLVGEPRPGEYKRPGAERRDRRVLALVAACGQRDRLDEGIFREYPLHALRI